MALGLRQGEVLGLAWDDLELPTELGAEGTMVIRRQLQRVTWQNGCADPPKCVNGAGKPGKRPAPVFVAVCLVAIVVFEPIVGLPAAVAARAKARAAAARLTEVFPERPIIEQWTELAPNGTAFEQAFEARRHSAPHRALRERQVHSLTTDRRSALSRPRHPGGAGCPCVRRDNPREPRARSTRRH